MVNDIEMHVLADQAFSVAAIRKSRISTCCTERKGGGRWGKKTFLYE